ncbi:hypothetical protein CEUSTIGMA_g2534.t1 [Chlamydomonas eustigma]|uniref:Uncharacterized protein n=1 Tax=Chlamydomonas eustigma TaxID=1157962 RepID=A0A250WX32_9CHLO|nr:hypothetical protein CEUSTIGMA_g2534.t1 [Chlamydomonas eustigma]|eukprot:GAX75090.1 hypothetical protein CEUSTIGMA_g2534.t1 [Chlamydomonas eustigma]
MAAALETVNIIQSSLKNEADKHHGPEFFVQSLLASHQKLFEDVVFDEARWDRHRNSWYRYRIEPSIALRVAYGFMWQILLVILASVLVGLYHMYLVPLGLPPSSSSFNNVFIILTFALSLLLVFKTNSSFARWWEGRIIWGQIVNFARNYARMMLQWSAPDKGHVAKAAVRWAAAAPHVLRGYIRQMKDEACKEAAHILLPVEIEYLSKWVNMPGGVASMLSLLISELELEPQQQTFLEDQVSLYVNMAGACERIYRTPIPAAYTRHTSRFLMIFLVSAPILMWQSALWATPVIMAIVAFLLLGTENIGVQIEEPFRVLPLGAICKTIENNLFEMEKQLIAVKQARLNTSVPQ